MAQPIKAYIIREREHCGLNEIAARFGVSRRCVECWLAGTRRPSQTALILCELLARGKAGEWPMIGE